MEIENLELDGAALIHGPRFTDDRGWFEESWSAPRLAGLGFFATFVQDNLSYSSKAKTLRGLHYQRPPNAQGKLVSVVTGAVRDVIVDLRTGSRTYGQHLAVDLNADNPVRLWAPPGFLHGFLTLVSDTRVSYKVTAAYDPRCEGAIAWNDPDLGIKWGVEAPVLSPKDAAAPLLRELGDLFPDRSV